MRIKKSYTFDDVLLVPKYSDITSRSNVDLSVDLGNNVKLTIPLISANMATISETVMVNTISKLGGLGLLHRFCPIEKQVQMFKDATVDTSNVGCSIGVKEYDKDNVAKLVDAGCKIICIDVAHGDSKLCNDMTEYVAKKYPQVLLISGNVCTGSGAKRLYNSGANVIKVNIGAGSLCTTRIETGNGMAQLTALEEVFNVAKYGDSYKRPFKIISDGACRYTGDLVKSLVYSDAVMTGNLLSATRETPGEIVEKDGKKYKIYAGSSTHKLNNIEGVVALQPYKEKSVTEIVEKLMEGLRSGCSYQGASNLEELKEDPIFVEITNSGLKESHPHALSSAEEIKK